MDFCYVIQKKLEEGRNNSIKKFQKESVAFLSHQIIT